MIRRLSLLTLVAIAPVLAIPAFASATTGLTEGGNLVPVGSEFAETNVGNIILTSSKTGNLSCTKATLFAKVETNTTAAVKASSNGAARTSSATGCSVPSGASVTVSEIKLNEISGTGEVVSGSTKRTHVKFSFKLQIGSLVCSYSTSTGESTYTAGGSEMTISEQSLSVTPSACGTTARLDGKFTIETTVSPFTALTLD